MVVLQEVSVAFGRRRVLSGLSLTVPEGGSLALWGPNGAGKSTTLHAILGLVPYTGRILVAGRDARTDGVAARRRLGWVPQNLNPPDMTVARTIRFLAQLRELAPPALPTYLEPFGLAGVENLPVAALSGGQRQRLALALALIGDPPILLLDEPTASLDTEGRRAVLQLLARLRRQGKTLLLASHRPADVARLADRVALLDDGHLLHIGLTAGLAASVRRPQPGSVPERGMPTCAGQP